jgi:hypothetical protein
MIVTHGALIYAKETLLSCHVKAPKTPSTVTRNARLPVHWLLTDVLLLSAYITETSLSNSSLSMGYTYLLTYLRSGALPEKLSIVQPFRKFPAILKEPEGSSPSSQETSTGPYPKPDRSSTYHISRIHCNIFQPPTSWSSQRCLSFRLCHQYPICIPLINMYQIKKC